MENYGVAKMLTYRHEWKRHDVHGWLPPARCPWCGHPRKMNRSHRDDCQSMQDGPLAHQVAPGLWVGSAGARCVPWPIAAGHGQAGLQRVRSAMQSGAWGAVVSVFTEIDSRWVGSLPPPSCQEYRVDHSDRTPGLLAPCDTPCRNISAAWDFIDMARGPVLIHCLQGASRSVAVAAGYLIARTALSGSPERQVEPRAVVQTALRAVSVRPAAIHLWPGFVAELEEVARNIQSKENAA